MTKRKLTHSGGSVLGWLAALGLLLLGAGQAKAAYNLYIYPEPGDGSLGYIVAPTNVTDYGTYASNLPFVVTTPNIWIEAAEKPLSKFLRWELVYGGGTISQPINKRTLFVYGGTNDVYIKATFLVGVRVTSTNTTGTVGSPVPGSGINYYNVGDQQRFTVTSPFPMPIDPVNYRTLVSGWTGTGSITPSGSGNQTDLLSITNSSTIKWNWTDEYKLIVEIEGGGAVTRNPSKDWYTNGESVFLTAYAIAGNYFLAWDDGKVTTTNSVTMNGVRKIKAVFGSSQLDNDGDGLPDLWEIKFGLNPNSAVGVNGAFGDPDNDLLANIQEYIISHVLITNGAALFEASPINADSDGDGMDDGYEFYHLPSGTNVSARVGDQRNAAAVVSAIGVNGRDNNADQDFRWNTTTGYRTDVGLRAYEEYVGPDSIVPGTWTSAVAVAGITKPVYRYQVNWADTGDQSFADAIDSEIVGGSVQGDGFDDGYEYSWDEWQSVHGGDPVGDPLNHFVPYRSVNAALPMSVVIANFNGGPQDLAIANAGHDSVSVLYGRNGANGIFNPPDPRDEWGVGRLPVAIASADLVTGGAVSDLVTANMGTNTISVLLRAGNGFNVSHYTAGYGPSCVAVGDFNRNGTMDVAVSVTNGNVVIFQGDGLGGLTLQQTIPIGAGRRPAYIAAGILRAPTNTVVLGGVLLDLVVANEGNDSITVITNNGTGTFAIKSEFGVGSRPKAVEIGEFSGDMYNDLAWVEYGDNNVRSRHGNGDGSFLTPGFTKGLPIGAGPRHLARGQFDAIFPVPNNTMDLVVVNELNDTVAVLLGSKDDASFASGTTVDVGDSPMWVAVGRINNDQLDDFVVVNRNTDSVYVYFGRGDGSFFQNGNYDCSARIADRRYNPAQVHKTPPDAGRPDYDVMYDPVSGGSGKWLTDEMEYAAWRLPFAGTSNGVILRQEFPGRPRCSHPFYWDVDRDQMPDGWEMAFAYDPWDADTDNDGTRDGNENPDGDWFAQDALLPSNRHFNVYLTYGFHPGTGYGYLTRYGPAGPNTAAYINYEELIGDRGLAAITEDDPDDRATHPFKLDSDDDGIWDGWEYYMALDAQDPLDANENYDAPFDGLSNFEEFQSWATSTNIMAARTAVPGWQNKRFPTDIYDWDTDYDQTSDSAERGHFNFTQNNGAGIAIFDEISGEITYEWFIGGGLCPTTADTDKDYLPDGWEAEYPGAGDVQINAQGVAEVVNWAGGQDGTTGDMYADYDGDGLMAYQEYFAGAVYHWQWLYNDGTMAWAPGRGLYGYEPFDFFDDELSGNLWYVGPGGRQPYTWDPNYYADPPFNRVEWHYITGTEVFPAVVWMFSGTDPRDPDTDWDNMDDYWETFHGLDPLMGTLDVVASKVLFQPVPFPGLLIHLQALASMDMRVYPWISGTDFHDGDQDELQNIFESVQLTPNLLRPPYDAPYYHTDPSPHWVTDTSSDQSWVNLYYWLGMRFGCHGPMCTCAGGAWEWYWDLMVLYLFDAPPTYAFSFENHEGFDTDTDGLSDVAELTDQAQSPGVTDWLESQSPIKRRALYLNGNAAARTRVSHFLDDYRELRTFTVEAWARPQNSRSGRTQVVTEKGGIVPQGNVMGWPSAYRANYKVGIDPDGRPFAGYHGSAADIQFVEAKASPGGSFLNDRWYHVATTYDGSYMADGHFVGLLKLYVDGEIVSVTPSSEIPWNGWFGGIQSSNAPAIGYILGLGMPAVIGAGDDNPNGVVDGGTFYVGWPACNVFGQPVLREYFTGWIDNVLVWDGPRTREEIRSTMRTRWTRRQTFNAKTVRQGAKGALLFFAYTFDDLPDPDHGPVSPDGFQTLNGRPMGVNTIPWWASASDRSRIYTDYLYVPWIDNLAVHNPLDPPVDSRVPNPDGLQYPNTANPYVFGYFTASRYGAESFGRLSSSSFRDDAGAHLSDLLPLRWAEADEDVEMWDNGTLGTDPYDSDFDGLPDSWEERFGLDPRDPNGDHGPDGDLDNDGLSNLYEYYTQNDPTDPNTDGDDRRDPDEDLDADGLVNKTEFALGTMPHMPDSDDDGLSDWEEVTGSTDPVFNLTRPATSLPPSGRTDPLDSLEPGVQRSMYFNGNARVIVPPQNKLMAPTWTVEAWVKPEAGGVGGVIVCRRMEGAANPTDYGINYELGLVAESAITNRPYIRYRASDGQEVRVNGTGLTEITGGLAPLLIPVDKWSHLAGTYDQASLTLSLYVNGKLAAYRTDASLVPPTVFGFKQEHGDDEVTIGAWRSTGPVILGFRGWIDEVRIWRGARSADEIFDRYNAPEGVPSDFANERLRLKSRYLNPVRGISQSLAGVPSDQSVHMLIQADSDKPEEDFAAVQQAGGVVLNAVSPNTRTVVMTPAQLQSVGSRVRWAGTLEAKDKISGKLGFTGSKPPRNVLVMFHDDIQSGVAVSTVQGAGAQAVGTGFIAGKYVVASASDAQVQALASRDAVARIIPCPSWLTDGRPVRYCPHEARINGTKVAPYALVGEGWDGPGLGEAYLTYYFYNTTPDLDATLCRRSMTDQLAKWATYAALYFSESATPGREYSFDIGFGMDPAGAFDGPFGVLAYGYFPNDINPEPIAGDCYYDEDETWTIAGTGIDLRFVSLHEFGHCLGMGHSDDPTAVMFPFYSGSNEDPVLQADDIDGIQALYASAQGTGRAEFRFDDGGLSAEDFSTDADWLTGWASAAIPNGAVFSLDTPPLDRDSDGDQMPDWWEIGNGLNPYDPSGENGPYGDVDRDELNNIYEYYADTDAYPGRSNPRVADTDNNGFVDYDSGVDGAGNGRTAGERYDDGDRIPDGWEIMYRGYAPTTGQRGLDPAYYDAHLDPDEDGWSNYAEYMGYWTDMNLIPPARVRSSNPLSPTNYPMPIIEVRARYFGMRGADIRDVLAGGATVRLNFYGTPAMDGTPWGTLTMDQDVMTVDALTTGHMIEGTNYVFGFLDMNNNGIWDWSPTPGAGEPAGIADPQPVIGWGDINSVEIGLTDFRQGYPRFTWTQIPTASGYYVTLKRGTTTIINNRYIANRARNYLHEGDYLAAGVMGLSGVSPFSTYVLTISYEEDVSGHKYLNPHPQTGMFSLVDLVTLSQPSFITSHGFTYDYARNEIEWSMVAGATSYRIEVARTNNGPAIASRVAPAPYRSVSGSYRAELPVYGGDTVNRSFKLTNGTYRVRVRAEIPGVTPSPWREQSFNLNVREPQAGGKSMITGDVYYFGKTARGYGPGLTNDLRIIVQSFTSAGFSGRPDSQVEFGYVCNTNNPATRKGAYKLMGLHTGVHYVRAFLDLNGNRALDFFEPYGFAVQYQTDWEYQPRSIHLTGSGSVAVNDVRIVIRDRDTDDDGLPDGWEYSALGGTLGYDAGQDPDGDGASNLQEYEDTWIDSDPLKYDTDGDGVSDGDELRLGLLTHVADTDGDGIADGVEVALGLDARNALGDYDGDGIIDAVEILRTKTDPRSGADVLRFIKVMPCDPSAPEVFRLEWDGKPGVAYQVQFSADLRTWLNVPNGRMTGAGVGLSHTERNPGTGGLRFYRVIVL